MPLPPLWADYPQVCHFCDRQPLLWAHQGPNGMPLGACHDHVGDLFDLALAVRTGGVALHDVARWGTGQHVAPKGGPTSETGPAQP
jgi:hypothetical protein